MRRRLSPALSLLAVLLAKAQQAHDDEPSAKPVARLGESADPPEWVAQLDRHLLADAAGTYHVFARPVGRQTRRRRAWV